MEAGVEPT